MKLYFHHYCNWKKQCQKMREASNIVKGKGKVSSSSPSSHNSLSLHKPSTDPVDWTNIDYFYMMISSRFSAVCSHIPTNYFAILIHHLYGLDLADDAVDNTPIHSSSIDPETLNAFCSTADFIAIH
eukprot:911840-Ditylum_brightwellii.AAC.1